LYVDSNAVLSVNAGCRVYVHGNAPIVIAGSLRVNGLRDTANHVVFRGDRLDEPYSNLPAAWPGIFFAASSANNLLQYAEIRNAYQAIAITDPSPSVNPKLQLSECIIDNAYDAGIVGINSSIRAQNCQISNCGKNIVLVKGGDYQFTHCTVASYGNNFIAHREPVLLLSNFINVNNNPVAANLSAVFRNCIFWGQNGTVDNEVMLLKNGNTAFNVTFDHPLWKVTTVPAPATVINALNNQDPRFDSVDVGRNFYNFRLKANSPAVNRGVPTSVLIDLDGNPRPVGMPDLGCFEFR